MMTPSSKKPELSTGDWLPEGSGTPQDHAHVGRTAPKDGLRGFTNGKSIVRPR